MDFIRRSMYLLLACSIAGCAGMGMPQQPRFEPSESTGLLQIQAHKMFVISRPLSFRQEVDGAVTIHTVSRAHSAAPRLSTSQSFVDDTLAQLDEALLPFLVPACVAPVPR